MTVRILLIAATLSAVTAGCASETPYVDARWGESVRSMITAQTADPMAAALPSAEAPQEGDGQRIETTLENYRKDVARGTADVQRDVVINVGD